MITELRQELSVSRQEVTDLKTMHAQELESTKTAQHREVCYSKGCTSMYVTIQDFIYRFKRLKITRLICRPKMLSYLQSVMRVLN